MALSRFFTIIIIASIGWAFFLLLTGNLYSFTGMINGKQGDPTMVAERDSADQKRMDPLLFALIKNVGGDGYQHGDTLYHLTKSGIVEVSVGSQKADGLFPTCKNTIIDIWLPLIGYLTFFCGLMNLLSDSKATEKMSRFLTPLFSKIFPDLPKAHPAYGYMTMNFAANFLGLDSAATPFGLKAMESMQISNPVKEKATNSQIMFLCLHAAGLTLIPTSIIGYRAAMNAANPADIMLPTIITSFVGTIAALVFVSIRQRINLFNVAVIGMVAGISLIIGGLMYFISQLHGIDKMHFTGNLSNGVLLFIILAIVAYAFLKEKVFTTGNTNIFDSFIMGAKEGFTTGVRILPYMIAMLAALSIFRNSGLMDIAMNGITATLNIFKVDPQIINAIPVALMRPFSAGGSRGFMLDAMKTYGADSLTGQLACLFQGAAETTFYVVALYFGSVSVKNTRYTLGIMLMVDFVCVITAIFVCRLYF
ncbi:MAG: spore maturation protein [Chitinophagaceae bacterium]|nr:spore maturation protein [Chitinophagaceae bacterium]